MRNLMNGLVTIMLAVVVSGCAGFKASQEKHDLGRTQDRKRRKGAGTTVDNELRRDSATTDLQVVRAIVAKNLLAYNEAMEEEAAVKTGEPLSDTAKQKELEEKAELKVTLTKKRLDDSVTAITGISGVGSTVAGSRQVAVERGWIISLASETVEVLFYRLVPSVRPGEARYMDPVGPVTIGPGMAEENYGLAPGTYRVIKKYLPPSSIPPIVTGPPAKAAVSRPPVMATSPSIVRESRILVRGRQDPNHGRIVTKDLPDGGTVRGRWGITIRPL